MLQDLILELGHALHENIVSQMAHLVTNLVKWVCEMFAKFDLSIITLTLQLILIKQSGSVH